MVGADAAVADFSATEIDAAQGGALGVVIDLFDPMEMPPNILSGQGRHIASYRYTCIDPPAEPTPAAVSLCDGQIGDPLKDNLIVVGGRSITNADGLVFENNIVTCETGVAPPLRETICDDGIDNDRDGLTDLDDPDCQEFDFQIVDPETFLPANIVGTDGDPSFGLLAYNAPTEADLGIGGDGSDVLLGESRTVPTQGFSLALGYPCGDLAGVESFDVSGTILEAVGAEFVGVQADNTADDGDPCSLILGVLVDAAPPFDGGVIPGLPQTQPLGRLGFIIPVGVDCGKTVLVSSADGANGRGNVPVRNVISVDNQAFAATVRPFNVIAEQRVRFFRGDCNFSLRSAGLDPVNIADAAAVVSFLFQVASLQFEPPCLDACDVNDDGRVDLADAIGILNFLFVAGSRFPPFPGPGLDENANATVPGIDVTDDDPLGCDDGSDCDVDALDPGGRGEP